jgi:hypothetical protein
LAEGAELSAELQKDRKRDFWINRAFFGQRDQL